MIRARGLISPERIFHMFSDMMNFHKGIQVVRRFHVSERTLTSRHWSNALSTRGRHLINAVAFASSWPRFSQGVHHRYWRSKAMLTASGFLAGTAGIVYCTVTAPGMLEWPKVSAEGPKDITPSRSIVSPADKTGMSIVLYQYQTCPFCCKVRAYLDYIGKSYDVVEVNPVLRQQIKFSKWKKVPIVVVQNGEESHQLNDSSAIISLLQSYFSKPVSSRAAFHTLSDYYPSVTYKNDQGKDTTEIMNRYFIMCGDGGTPASPEETESMSEERKWRLWVDDSLVHTLSPNIYRSPKEALQAFTWFSEVGEWRTHFPTWERLLVVYVGAAAMFLVGKRLKKRHALQDDVRESLYNACDQWIHAVGKQRNFMGGQKPNLADLAVFGVLSAIEGCVAFQDLLQHTEIGPWYDKMKRATQMHTGCDGVYIK